MADSAHFALRGINASAGTPTLNRPDELWISGEAGRIVTLRDRESRSPTAGLDMGQFLRTHATTILVAMITAAVTAGGPAIAEVLADYARDADKVDGRHAVHANTSVPNRKGKLVATDGTTGRLPDNIIRQARDSARLAGHAHRDLRSFPLPVQAAAASGTAMKSSSGVTLSPDSYGGLRLGMILPPDYRAGAPVYADIVYEEGVAGPCSWHAYADGLVGPVDGTSYNGGWTVSATDQEGLIPVPVNGNTFKKTFKWMVPHVTQPGTAIEFDLSRDGSHESDDCGYVHIRALRIRY